MEEKSRKTFDETFSRICDKGPQTFEDILIAAGLIFAFIVAAIVVIVGGLGALFMGFKALFTLALLPLAWAALLLAAASLSFCVLLWFALKFG